MIILRPVVGIGRPTQQLQISARQNRRGDRAGVGHQPVIIADKGHIIARGMGEGPLPVVGHHHNVGCRKMPEARIAKRVGQRRYFGVAPVVLNDEFAIRAGLCRQRSQGVPQGVGAIERWNDDRQQRHYALFQSSVDRDQLEISTAIAGHATRPGRPCAQSRHGSSGSSRQ